MGVKFTFFISLAVDRGMEFYMQYCIGTLLLVVQMLNHQGIYERKMNQ